MLGVCSLFIPASAPNMVNAGLSIDCNSFIFDLEDAVKIEEKDSARDILRYAIPIYDGKNIAIRINCYEGCWKEDLTLFNDFNIDTVVLPKADARFVSEVSALLDQYKSNAKIAILTELATSLENLPQIVKASTRVSSLLLGAEDYCLDMGIERTAVGQEIFYARNRLSNVARSYELEALDTPFSNTSDMESLEKDSLLAKSLGFTGKLAINPLQISTIQNVFLPSRDEVNWAKLVLDAVNDPENKGKGAFSLQGKMIDLPIIKRAEKLLNRYLAGGGKV
jgi:citrate lyase subunit beta/citryl-CoA lyase